MKELCIIAPGVISKELQSMVNAAALGTDPVIVDSSSNLPLLKNRRILFAVELNNAGFSIGILEILEKLYSSGVDALSGSIGALLIKSPNQLFTKSAAQNIVFLANLLGCEFPGHPAVEATEGFENLRTWQKNMNLPLQDICIELSKRLGERLQNCEPATITRPKILALHSSSRKTSNTLELWHMVSKDLLCCDITELHVENGDVLDCKGCSYKTCTHYSSQNSCFYGGIMIKEILPAIQKSDAVVWICPNYNDALSANLTAVINRLTALYRTTNFYNKTIFSVIVSGNSGSDSLARQLIGALNINKGFRLPPYFSIMATANDTGEIKKVNDIGQKAFRFAQNIVRETKA